MITTVTGNNQITIPAALANAAGIQPGTRVNWTSGGEGILIAQLLPSRGELARKAAGMGRQWLPEGRDPIAELTNERTQADHEEGLEEGTPAKQVYTLPGL